MPEVQESHRFLADFLSEAKKAKNRIYLQSLLFEAGDVLAQCEPIFIEKAKAGVDVHITLDSIYAQYVGDNLNFIIEKVDPQESAKVKNATQKVINRWSAAGVKFTFTNKQKFIAKVLPIYRRNHIKIYVVDDIVWLGGVNSSDESIERIDFMVKFTDKIVVKDVAKQFYQVDENRSKHDYTIPSPPQTILVDAGYLGKSIIFDTATTMVTQSTKRVIFVSQFIPDGKLLTEILLAAAKGIAVTVITSPKDVFTHFPYNIPYQSFRAKMRQYPNIKLFHQHKKVHAKLLIIDDMMALFGSHNLVQLGVLLGTEEIAVKTTDTALVRNLKKFVEENTTHN